MQIDEYSLSSFPIEMFFNETKLSLGTAFTWLHGRQGYLVTNWHNVSGRNPTTGKHLSSNAAEPNRVRAWFNKRGELGNKIGVDLDLRDKDSCPRWLVHPSRGHLVDVVALPLFVDAQVELHAINQMDQGNLAVRVGMDVFILGFPLGNGPAGLPVWKRGSLATEPDISPELVDCMLVDTASRSGMSGSPVIRRSWATHVYANGSIGMGAATSTTFVGVYSGRLMSSDPLDAALGLVWPANLLNEIIKGATQDSGNW